MNFENWPVNPGDVAVLVILLISALLAFARGFVREVLSIAGWIGAALVTIYAFPYAQPFLAQYIQISLLANVITGVVIFIVALIVFSTISHLIAKLVRGTALNAVDRSLGFVFGIVRGAVLVCLAYLLLIWAMPTGEEQPMWIAEAKSRPLVERGAEMLKEIVPEDAFNGWFAEIDTAREHLEDGANQVDTLQQLSQPQPRATEPAPGNQPPKPPARYDEDNRNQLNQAVEGAQ